MKATRVSKSEMQIEDDDREYIVRRKVEGDLEKLEVERKDKAPTTPTPTAKTIDDELFGSDK